MAVPTFCVSPEAVRYVRHGLRWRYLSTEQSDWNIFNCSYDMDLHFFQMAATAIDF